MAGKNALSPASQMAEKHEKILKDAAHGCFASAALTGLVFLSLEIPVPRGATTVAISGDDESSHFPSTR
jgi:hypothetical protein